jgi:hypothetical protein
LSSPSVIDLSSSVVIVIIRMSLMCHHLKEIIESDNRIEKHHRWN